MESIKKYYEEFTMLHVKFPLRRCISLRFVILKSIFCGNDTRRIEYLRECNIQHVLFLQKMVDRSNLDTF